MKQDGEQSYSEGVARLNRLLGALTRHFDVLAGEARDTQAIRQQIAGAADGSHTPSLFDTLEQRLLNADEALALEREREEKTLGYLQRQCEDMNATTRQVQTVLQRGECSSDELGEASGELERVADRLMVLERKINELRSGVRNRSDLAFKDDWTGLYRDDGFQMRANELFARWQRAGSPLSAVVVTVNVAEGRALTPLSRNELMQQTAADLEARVRTSDVVGVTGDDEFTLLLPDTNLEGCHAFASRMVVALETAGFSQLGTQLRVEVIAGITSGVEGDSLDSFLGRAAQARQEALAKGACCEALI